MAKVKVKHFNNQETLTVFIDKMLAKRRSISVQATTEGGFTVCHS